MRSDSALLAVGVGRSLHGREPLANLFDKLLMLLEKAFSQWSLYVPFQVLLDVDRSAGGRSQDGPNGRAARRLVIQAFERLQ